MPRCSPGACNAPCAIARVVALSACPHTVHVQRRKRGPGKVAAVCVLSVRFEWRLWLDVTRVVAFLTLSTHPSTTHLVHNLSCSLLTLTALYLLATTPFRSLLRAGPAMAWLSSGRTNTELVDRMVANGLIGSDRVAEAMKAVDRGHYVNSAAGAYDDSPQ